jgi:pimeloyl-ACP methyl ester carboxylesterase
MCAAVSIGWSIRVTASWAFWDESRLVLCISSRRRTIKRIRVAVFNHASTYVADVVWHGQSTRHIRQGIDRRPRLETLRHSWLAVSPMSYFDKFARWPKKSLIIYAKYDLTFLPELSRHAVDEFERHGLDHKVVVLPCGHYTMGETPFKYMDGWQWLRSCGPHLRASGQRNHGGLNRLGTR